MMNELQVLVEMTNGGVDRAVECTGNINAMISAFECVHDVIYCSTHIYTHTYLSVAIPIVLSTES